MALSGMIMEDLPNIGDNQKVETGPKLGILGKIKIGEKNEKGHPTSLDYFRCDSQASYQKLFNEAHGERPSVIQVAFLSDDPAHCCNARYELRDKRGDLCVRSDGRVFEVAVSDGYLPKTKEEVIEKYGSVEKFVAEAVKHYQSPSGWETVLTLRFVLPKMKNLIGEWQLTTKASKTSMAQIISTWQQIKERAGTVIMIPFDLRVQMAESNRHKVRRRYPVLDLIPNAGLENLETIKAFLENGEEVFRGGMLTAERIEQLKAGKKDGPKQLGSGK